jgi:hypothetical protein
MSRRQRCTVLLASGILVVTSLASDRWYAVYTGGGLVVEVDKTQILQYSEKTYRLWVRYIFVRPQHDDPRGEYETQLADAEVRCSSLEYRFLTLHRYHAEKLVHTFPQNPTEPWQRLIPETNGEAIWKTTCHDLSGALAPFVKQQKQSSRKPPAH